MTLPQRANVVVIGAGFAGASTAYHLAAGGVGDVLLLEQEATAGHHASGRNAGQCRALVEDDAVTELTVRGANFLREPPPGFSRHPLLKECGGLLASARADVLDELAARARRHQLPCERIDLSWILRRWPRLSGLPLAGGIHFPGDGVIDIHALLEGFLAGARAGGVGVALGCRIERVSETRVPGVIVVETNKGSVETCCLVNAAGAWAGEIGATFGSDSTDFAPIHRHLHVTERLPKLDRSLPYFWYVDEGDEFYLRPEGGGLLISGCDAAVAPPGDARARPEAREDLAAKLERLTPWMAELPIARTWACLRTFTPSGRPVIGWDQKLPWLFWVAGLGGTGATSAPAVGELAATEIKKRVL